MEKQIQRPRIQRPIRRPLRVKPLNSGEIWFSRPFLGDEKLNTNFFFSQTFRAPLGYRIPAKSRDIPPGKFDFLVSRNIPNFLAPPLHVEDSYPTGKSPNSQVWVRALFLGERQRYRTKGCSRYLRPNTLLCDTLALADFSCLIFVDAVFVAMVGPLSREIILGVSNELGGPDLLNSLNTLIGGHLKPVTLKPVIRIFRIFRVFVSAFFAFSAFSAFLFCRISSDPCFSGVRGTFRIFRIFPACIGFESLISKIRPTGFRMTGLW